MNMIWLPSLLGHENMWLCYSKCQSLKSYFFTNNLPWQWNEPWWKMLAFQKCLKNSKFVFKKAFLELYTFLNIVFCHKPLSTTCIIWNGLLAKWELRFLANLVSNDPQMKWLFTVACVAMIPKEAAKCVSTTDCDEMTNNASDILCFWFLLSHSNKQQCHSVYTLYFSSKPTNGLIIFMVSAH